MKKLIPILLLLVSSVVILTGCQSDGCIVEGCEWGRMTDQEKLRRLGKSLSNIPQPDNSSATQTPRYGWYDCRNVWTEDSWGTRKKVDTCDPRPWAGPCKTIWSTDSWGKTRKSNTCE